MTYADLRSRIARATAAGLTAASLAACASLTAHPDPVANDVALPAQWTHGAASSTPSPLIAWWQRFDDAMLAQLVSDALAANNDVRSAEAALRQGRAQRDVTAAGLYPSLNATGSAQRAKGSGGKALNTFSTGFDASWELDVFGGTRAAVAAADADARASALSLANVRVSVAAETASTYVQLATFTRRRVIARANLTAQEETLSIARWRVQAGLTTSLDVEQARSSAEITRATIPALDASIAQAWSALAVLTGRTPESLQASRAVRESVPVAEESLAIAFPAEALRQRPDLHQAEETARAAASRVTQADAARYPSFALNGSLGLAALTLTGLSGGNALVALVAGAVSWPVFDGGSRAAQVRVQDASLEQAKVAYDATLLNALKEVEDALAALASSRERLGTLRNAADAAKNAALIARFRYDSGIADFQPVLQTQVTQLSVEESVANAEADLALAHVKLYKAVGGGWEPAADNPPAAQNKTTSRETAS